MKVSLNFYKKINSFLVFAFVALLLITPKNLFSGKDVFGYESEWAFDSTSKIQTKEEFETLLNQTVNNSKNYNGWVKMGGINPLPNKSEIELLQKVYKYRYFAGDKQKLIGVKNEDGTYNTTGTLLGSVVAYKSQYPFDANKDGSIDMLQDNPDYQKVSNLWDLLNDLTWHIVNKDIYAELTPDENVLKILEKADENAVVLKYTWQDSIGSVVEGFLSIDENGAILGISNSDILNPSCQIKINVFRNKLAISSPVLPGKFLHVPPSSNLSENNLQSVIKNSSKLSFSKASYDKETDLDQQFEFIKVSPESENQFYIRSVGSHQKQETLSDAGYLVKEQIDDYFRVYNSSLKLYDKSQATIFKIIPLTKFHKELTKTRQALELSTKLDLFKAIAESDGIIKTNNDLTLLLDEMQTSTTLAIKEMSNWQIEEIKIKVEDVILALRKKQSLVWKETDASGNLTSFAINIAERLGPDQDTADQIGYKDGKGAEKAEAEKRQVVRSSLFYTSIFSSVVQEKFSDLKTYQQKVDNLLFRANNLTTENIDNFKKDLSSVINTDQDFESTDSLEIKANFEIVQAFQDDKDKLSKIIEKIYWNQNFTQWRSEKKLDQMYEYLNQEISFSVYLEEIKNYLESDLLNSDTFLRKAQRLADLLNEQQINPFLLEDFAEVLSLAASNQVQDKAETLRLIAKNVLIQLPQDFASLSYSGKVEFVKNQLEFVNQVGFDKQAFLNNLEFLVNKKLEASANNLKTLTDILYEASLKNGLSDQESQTKIKNLTNQLEQNYSFEGIYQDLKQYGVNNEILSNEKQTAFLNKSSKLPALAPSTPLSKLEEVINFLEKVKINNISKNYWTNIDEIIEKIAAEKTEQFLTFSKKIDILEDKFEQINLEAGNVNLLDVKDFIQDQLFEVITSKVDAKESDLARLKELLEAISWNQIVNTQNYTFEKFELGGETINLIDQDIKKATGIFTQYLDEEISFAKRVESLTQILKQTSILDEEKANFLERAQGLKLSFDSLKKEFDAADLNTKNTIITMVQNATEILNQARFNQIREFSQELELIINQLKEFESYLEVDEKDLTYAQKILKLDQLRNNLSEANFSEFQALLNDPEAGLISNLVQGLKSDLNNLSQIIEKAIKHPLFKTANYKDQVALINAHLETIKKGKSFQEHLVHWSFRVENALEPDELEKKWILQKAIDMVEIAQNLTETKNNIELLENFLAWLESAKYYTIPEKASEINSVISKTSSIIAGLKREQDAQDLNPSQKIEKLKAILENYYSMNQDEQEIELNVFFAEVDDLKIKSENFELLDGEILELQKILNQANSLYGIEADYKSKYNITSTQDHYDLIAKLEKKFNQDNVNSKIETIIMELESQIAQGKTFSSREKTLTLENINLIVNNLALYNQNSEETETKKSILNRLVIAIKTLQKFIIPEQSLELESKVKAINKFIDSLGITQVTSQDGFEIYLEQLNGFTLTVSNFESFVTLINNLIENKTTAKQTDLQEAIEYFQTTDFLTNEVMLWGDGKNQILELVEKLKAKPRFEEVYSSFVDMTRKIINLSAKNQTDVYTIEVVKEHLKFFLENPKQTIESGINSQELILFIKSLKNYIGSISFNFYSFEDPENPILVNDYNLLEKHLRQEIKKYQIFSRKFSEKINFARNFLRSLSDNLDSEIFYNILNSLSEKQIAEAEFNDINNLIDLVQETMYTNKFNYTITPDQQSLNDIATKLASQDVNNNQRQEWLLKILKIKDRPKFYDEKIIDILNQMVSTATIDAIDYNQGELLDLLKRSVYESLADKKNQILSFVDSLEIIWSQESKEVETSQIDQFEESLDAIIQNPTIADLSTLVKNAINIINNIISLNKNDHEKFVSLLKTLEFKDIFKKNKNTQFNSEKTYAEIFNELVLRAEKEITFQERLEDLIKFYQDPTKQTPESHQEFMRRAEIMFDMKNENLISRTDNLDLILSFIDVLRTAAFNKLKNYSNQISKWISDLESFRTDVLEGIPLKYSDRINTLKDNFNNLTTNSYPELIVQIQNLIQDRAQATDKMIKEIKDILSDEKISGSRVIFNLNKEDEIKNLRSQFDRQIPLDYQVDELARLINENEAFDQDLEAEVMEKVKKAFENRGRAADDNIELKDLEEIINFLIQEYFYNNTSKKKELEGYLKDLYQPPSQTFKSFEVKLKEAESLLKEVKNITLAKNFIQQLVQLAENLVEATTSDIDYFKELLASEKLKDNEFIFLVDPDYNFVDQINTKILEPISFVDRVNNFTSLFKNNTTFNDNIKKLVLKKIELLFQERWRAQQEQFNLETLQSLINVMIANRLDQTIDREIIDQINYYNNNMLSKVDSPSLNKFSYDYQDEIDKFKNMLFDLRDRDLNKFFAALDLLIKNRQSSVYADRESKKDQTEELKEWIESRVVQFHPVIFQSQRGSELSLKAEGLLEPVKFEDYFVSAQKLVLENENFNLKQKNNFRNRIEKMVDKKALAISQGFKIENLIDLIDFARKERFIDDTGEFETFVKNLKSSEALEQTQAVDFTLLLDELERFVTRDSQNPEIIESLDVNRENINEFLNKVEEISSKRVQASKQELDQAKKIINSPAVKYDDILFKDSKSRARLDLASEILDTPVSFAQLVDNFVNMIENNNYDSADFELQLNKIVNRKSEATKANVDLENLKSWIIYANTNQENASLVDVNQYLEDLLSKETQAEVEAYLSYRQIIDQFKTRLKENYNSKTEVEKLIKDLQKLVDSRLDGIKFNVEENLNKFDDIEYLKKFLDEELRYNPAVFNNTSQERILDSYLSNLDREITPAEMISNLEILINLEKQFSKSHEDEFLNKLKRIVFNRDKLNQSQVESIVRKIRFVKINKFSTNSTQVSKLDELSQELQTPKETLSEYEKKVQDFQTILENITTFDQYSEDEKTQILVNTVVPIAYGINEQNSNSETVDTVLSMLYQSLAKLFSPVTNQNSGLEDDYFANEINDLIEHVQQFK